MRLLPNVGTDRVLDWLRAAFAPGAACDAATPELSLFAFAELRNALEAAAACRLLMPDGDPGLLGGEADRAARNRLETRRLAAAAINGAKQRVLIEGIRYRKIGDGHYFGQELFECEELRALVEKLLPVTKSV